MDISSAAPNRPNAREYSPLAHQAEGSFNAARTTAIATIAVMSFEVVVRNRMAPASIDHVLRGMPRSAWCLGLSRRSPGALTVGRGFEDSAPATKIPSMEALDKAWRP